jgi:hypothetical protein
VEEPAEPKGPVSWASLFANKKAAPAVGSTAAASAGPEEVIPQMVLIMKSKTLFFTEVPSPDTYF